MAAVHNNLLTHRLRTLQTYNFEVMHMIFPIPIHYSEIGVIQAGYRARGFDHVTIKDY
jgi:hypothetical protein